jgi:hypothetical protein
MSEVDFDTMIYRLSALKLCNLIKYISNRSSLAEFTQCIEGLNIGWMPFVHTVRDD